MKLDVPGWKRWLEGGSRAAEGDGKGAPDAEPGPWSVRHPTVRLLLLLGLLGLILMTVSSPRRPATGPAAPAADEKPPATAPAFAGGFWGTGEEAALARALEEALGRIRGVGRVHVLVTLETSAQHVFAGEVTREKRVSDEGERGGERRGREERETVRPVLVRAADGRSEQPITEAVRAPRPRGVLVVAEGGDDPRIQRAITRAVEALTGLGAHRVVVLGSR